LPEALADWCDGFLLGHHYLEDLWAVALDDLDDDHLFEKVGETLDWALTFVEGEIVDWTVDESDELLLTEYLQFQQLLEDYRAVHTLWYQGNWQWNIEQTFSAMQPVARDELCPCGSGRLFMYCCLH
jgi:uncharacterized protein YecA (UPF0149 family)